jgi:hypothetical protein
MKIITTPIPEGLSEALLELLKLAGEKDLIIKEIGLPARWLNGKFEVLPEKLLGVKIQ